MMSWQLRVIDEHKALNQKIAKLLQYIAKLSKNDERLTDLEPEHLALLKEQYVVMVKYAEILQKRINLI